MGLRFRKSVKIAKGVRVSFSKSGPRLTLGGRGHSVSFGKGGTRASFGIPGTGISYSTKLTGGHHKAKSSPHKDASSKPQKSAGTVLPNQVQIIMNADGKIEIQDTRGLPITDQSVISRIKATDSYKKLVQNLELQRQTKLEEVLDEAREENEKFIEIHRLSPQVDKEENYLQILNSLNAPVYTRKQYDVPYPTEEAIRELLKNEAKEKVHGNMFSVGGRRKDYVETNLPSRLNQAQLGWTQAKERFETAETENEKAENERLFSIYEENRQYMNDLINGEESVVNEAVESWIASCELPVEIDIDYEWHPKDHLMYLDVDLPEIEDLPEDEIVRLASGNLKEKKKSQTTLKQEYIHLVFGLAIFISANIFNTSPSIHGIVISGYTQRRNKAGDLNDEYVYSIKFTRDIFENSILKNVSSRDFCMRFENRTNITSSFLMKKIEPFTTE